MAYVRRKLVAAEQRRYEMPGSNFTITGGWKDHSSILVFKQ